MVSIFRSYRSIRPTGLSGSVAPVQQPSRTGHSVPPPGPVWFRVGGGFRIAQTRALADRTSSDLGPAIPPCFAPNLDSLCVPPKKACLGRSLLGLAPEAGLVFCALRCAKHYIGRQNSLALLCRTVQTPHTQWAPITQLHARV